MGATHGVRRYRVVGGLTACTLPVLAGAVVVAALAADAGHLAVGAAAAGAAATALARSLVIQVAPAGLARGFVLRSIPLGWSVALPWRAIVEVHTDWHRRGGDSAIETTVSGVDGTAIRLSSAMGLDGYWACLADIARGAPWALRSGLTDTVLAEGPPTRRDVLSAAGVAGALALVLVAMAGIHYVWSHGRSSLQRDLDDAGTGSAAGGEGRDGAFRDGRLGPGRWPDPARAGR
jgi:hypothetical protein